MGASTYANEGDLELARAEAEKAKQDLDQERQNNLGLRDAIVENRKQIGVLEGRVQSALAAVGRWNGACDGDHHKAWLIDQVVRVLTGGPVVDDVVADGDVTEEYKKFVADYEEGEDGSDTYEWSRGVAP